MLLPIQARKQRWRLFHATDPEAVPDPSLMPLTATVYDLIPLHDEQVWSRMTLLQRAGFRRMLANVRRARSVVTISEAVRNDLVARLGIAEARIVVARPGIDLEEWPMGSDRERCNVLFVGAPAPHKNLRLLVKSLASMPALDRPKLTVVGPWSVNQIAELEEQCDGVGVRVEVEPFASHDRLIGLYHSSALLAMPSRYEGFGLPALEAMATGCPVVASDTPALVEVVGEAGRIVNLESAGELAAVIRDLVSDPAEQRRLGRAGRARAKEFSWDQSAALLWTHYQSIVD
jgi:glycosyltransferase involved in cell wall biosynthesis